MLFQSKRGKGRSALRILARIVALTFTAWLLAWVAASALIVHSEPVQSEALAILAGSSTYQERARWAAHLFKEGRAPKIVLTDDGLRSGWSIPQQRNPFFVERAADELKRLGVPPERIEIIPQVVSNTHQEAVRLREYAEGNELRSILIVSNPYQSRRALWTLRRVFEGSGIEVLLDAPPPGQQSPPPATWWRHRLGWQLVPSEYLKMAYYLTQY
jgi:uncharacterized SAM-binding protein YcdF (DUF218 family)